MLRATLAAGGPHPPSLPAPCALLHTCFYTVFVDVTRKGAVLSAAAAQAAYPSLLTAGAPAAASAPDTAAAASASQLRGGSEPWGPPDAFGVAALEVWVDMARTMVLAHQRRGESDAVAHWIYQLLALDPLAAEWQHALAAVR